MPSSAQSSRRKSFPRHGCFRRTHVSRRFAVAGHETTSTGTTWCLYQLTQSPDVQRRLRDELLQLPTETPTMDQLNALPYLDMVVKESLRCHTPAGMSFRMAMQDDVIPLNAPVTDRRGVVRDNVKYAVSHPAVFV